MKTNTLRLPFCDRTFAVSGSEKDGSIMDTIEKQGGFYETGTMLLLGRIIKQGSICLDIGANIGVCSLALGYLAEKGAVYAFEPSKNNLLFLEKNISQNNMGNVEAVNLGVYDSTVDLEFSYVEEFAGGSYLNVEGGVRDGRAVIEVVKCVSLDEWVKTKGISRIDFIKMDVEGAESRALDGAAKTLSSFKPNMIIEFNPHCIEKIFNEKPEDLYRRLTAVYPYVSLVDSANGSLAAFEGYSELLGITMAHGGVENIYCSFSKPQEVAAPGFTIRENVKRLAGRLKGLAKK